MCEPEHTKHQSVNFSCKVKNFTNLALFLCLSLNIRATSTYCTCTDPPPASLTSPPAQPSFLHLLRGSCHVCLCAWNCKQMPRMPVVFLFLWKNVFKIVPIHAYLCTHIYVRALEDNLNLPGHTLVPFRLPCRQVAAPTGSFTDVNTHQHITIWTQKHCDILHTSSLIWSLNQPNSSTLLRFDASLVLWLTCSSLCPPSTSVAEHAFQQPPQAGFSSRGRICTMEAISAAVLASETKSCICNSQYL